MIRPWNATNWLQFKLDIGNYTLYHPVKINEKKLDKMVETLYKVIDKACLLYTSPSPRDS